MTHERVNSQVGIFYDLWTSYNYEINESMACGVFLLSILLISLKQQQETLILCLILAAPVDRISMSTPTSYANYLKPARRQDGTYF